MLVFSLEMPSGQLVKRMFAAEARVNVSAMHKGAISPEEYMRVKEAALELNCPVIALSQLSRQAENRTDKKPQLADLRDSGAIEQDADTVMMMYRESYYTENENNDLRDDVAEIRIAKNRSGATGVCRLVFQR